MSDRNALIAEVLPEHRSWLYSVARGMAPDRSASDHDDLVQEGYIAMWRAVEDHDPAKGTMSAWLHTVARTRMFSVLVDPHRITGSDRRPVSQHAKRAGDETRQRIREYIREHTAEHGKRPSEAAIGRALGMNPGNVHRHLQRMHLHHGQGVREVVSLDALLDGSKTDSASDVDLDRWLMIDAVLEDVTLAYHYGEIHEALDSLAAEDRVLVEERFWHGKAWAEIERERGLTPQSVSGRWVQRIRPRLAEALAHLADAA